MGSTKQAKPSEVSAYPFQSTKRIKHTKSSSPFEKVRLMNGFSVGGDGHRRVSQKDPYADLRDNIAAMEKYMAAHAIDKPKRKDTPKLSIVKDGKTFIRITPAGSKWRATYFMNNGRRDMRIEAVDTEVKNEDIVGTSGAKLKVEDDGLDGSITDLADVNGSQRGPQTAITSPANQSITTKVENPDCELSLRGGGATSSSSIKKIAKKFTRRKTKPDVIPTVFTAAPAGKRIEKNSETAKSEPKIPSKAPDGEEIEKKFTRRIIKPVLIRRAQAAAPAGKKIEKKSVAAESKPTVLSKADNSSTTGKKIARKSENAVLKPHGKGPAARPSARPVSKNTAKKTKLSKEELEKPILNEPCFEIEFD